MSSRSDETTLLMAQRRFLDEVEQGIRLANREIIHERIPELGRQRIYEFAVAVARLRADYLAEALGMGHGTAPSAEVLGALRQKREAYDEARLAFEALHRAIERGYVDPDRAVLPQG